MIAPRTIHRRRHRAHKGQVSALVTVLGLLLVVTFIANFVLLQLPGEMQELEFQHTLQVENQLSRLQATILAQAANPGIPLTLSSPVTLGSQSVPPFGSPTTGSIASEPPGVATITGLLLTQVTYAYPPWNVGSACLAGGGGHCAGAGHVNYYNFSGNSSASLAIKVDGNTNSLVYVLNGNNDSITITWNGKDAGFINVLVNGSDDAITFNKGGSDTVASVSTFDFFGERDTFSYNPSGSHSSKGGQSVNVQFVGTIGSVCPGANLSSTDSIGTFSSGGSNINVNVTWWNGIGYVTSPSVQAYPGGSIPTEQITWQNRSGFIPCAFSVTHSSLYTNQFQGGVDVHLSNRYSPPTDVVYDQGAVILAQEGGTPVMVSPPRITTYLTSSGGVGANITLVNMLGNLTAEGGVTTAAVTSQVVQVGVVVVATGAGGVFVGGDFFLNITTLYPAAWSGYFSGFPQAFPLGSTCVPLTTIPAPYSCLSPPPGTAVKMVAPLILQQLRFTTITVNIGII
ncbi:MAG: hypothetical protein L3K19_07025 [Thermoplasmata archaeon]|nr:hypothetical protein [Thermoplasmata archaeon]